MLQYFLIRTTKGWKIRQTQRSEPASWGVDCCPSGCKATRRCPACQANMTMSSCLPTGGSTRFWVIEVLSVLNEIGTYQRWYAALGEYESSPFFQRRRQRWELPARWLVNMNRNSNKWRRVVELLTRISNTWGSVVGGRHAMARIDSSKPAMRNCANSNRLSTNPLFFPPHLSPTTPLRLALLCISLDKSVSLWHLPLSRQSRLQFLSKPHPSISAALQTNPAVSLRSSLNARYLAPVLLHLTMCERYLRPTQYIFINEFWFFKGPYEYIQVPLYFIIDLILNNDFRRPVL